MGGNPKRGTRLQIRLSVKNLLITFLEWFLHPEWADDITGDLEEIYLLNQERSKSYAELKFIGH